MFTPSMSGVALMGFGSESKMLHQYSIVCVGAFIAANMSVDLSVTPLKSRQLAFEAYIVR